MCGIAGILTRDEMSRDQLGGAVAAMTRTLVHRGPDDSGIWADSSQGIALGRQRLSILDLSPGRPPADEQRERTGLGGLQR